ncbi:hypothetical protein NP233_g11802 [Leucocoprinus birnbaumii]|uniref:Uncharacterized protein n=1 Tax=Leucocoprinus birnbaumii TaxID=56174 RepID=A0AAD5YL04_9AGAR|nr:hypothetical protein NP233_g11802 [Leucocoprinus birnbaumii]
MPQLGGSQGADVARHGSVLSNATAPAGMSTGLAGRRGSVGASVVTPQVASGARRAVSIDYGQPSRAGPSSSRSPVISGPSPPSQGPQESLMSIVNSVTNTNRRAWDTGLAESKMDRESGGRSTFLGPVPSGSGNYVAPEGHARDRVVAGRGSMDGASYTGSEKMGGVVKAPPRMDRQALMTSLKASPGSQGRAYQTTMQTSSVTQEKRPLKSAMRASRSPSPDAMHGGRVHAHGYSTETGKDRIVPMAAVPSASSLPTDGPPPPVQRVRGIGDNVAEYGREEEEDGYESPSSSSYETGHEDFDYEEVARPKRRKSSGLAAAPSASHTSQTGLRKVEYFDRRPGLGSPPLAVSSPHPPAQMSSDNPPQYGSFTPVSTPSRRKSVRVSLNPTFSPTPPAIEDEDDEDNRAPYVFREAPAPSTSVPPPVKQVPRNYGTQRTSRQTTWDDDSDDDVEYKRAKEMLAKAGRGY